MVFLQAKKYTSSRYEYTSSLYGNNDGCNDENKKAPLKKNGNDALECNKKKIWNFHKFIPRFL